jgi:DNA modification methylase
MKNRLFYGDNLAVLRGRDADGKPLIPDESIDLIYLDPPFNSAATYNVLFRAPDGKMSDSQLEAFEDSWHWGDAAAAAYQDVITQGVYTDASVLLHGMVTALGKNDMTAYLAMMAVRLIELHRVLKPTGSLYLHCDPTASHYLKILLDGIFGAENFRNEIVWKRSHAHNSARRYGRSHDIIFFYAKSENVNWKGGFHQYDEAYLAKHYRHVDKDGRRYKRENPTGAGVSNGVTGKEWRGINPTAKGRHWARNPAELERLDREGLIYWPNKPGAWPYIKRYLNDAEGVPLQDLWTDIDFINMRAQERLGYPTQKPLALLERIINASSNPGDVVLDPFCGCGTAVHAAEKLGRRWVGIDVTHLAISLVERRLKDAFPNIAFEVLGTPRDLSAARDLAARDKHQFQWWAVSLLDAVPQGGKKKGADRGIDGIRWVRTGPKDGDLDRVIISVKGGENVSVRDVRDLAGTVQREGALGGVLITLADPTRDMLREAASHGYASTGLGQFRKIMVKTIAELMAGVHDDAERLPPLGRGEGFRRAPRERSSRPSQAGLFE